MNITPQEKASIKKWSSVIEGEIPITLSLKNDEASSLIHSFCSEIVQLVPEITLKVKNDEAQLLPGILIGENISYNAIPLSNELEPFLKALYSPSPLVNLIPKAQLSVLEDIRIPAILKIYVSPHCIFCPKVVIRCLAMAKGNPSIRISVIDGTLFPDQASLDMIRSVPTVILDDTFRWIGEVNQEEMIKIIAKRDPLLLSPESLKQIIHEGGAEEVADMMVVRGEVFPSFLELLTNKNWTVRLGTMVAFDYLAEKRTDLASTAIVALWNMFPDMDDQVKGDIIYLFGESRDLSVLPFLKSVIKGTYSHEVKEAAEDALNNFI